MTASSGTPLSARASVLLVDDEPANLLALEVILDGLGLHLVKAPSGEEALLCLGQQRFAAVLLDVQMHGLDGFQTARLIRRQEASHRTPIVFLTAFDTERGIVEEAYALGAVDFLVKPLSPVILRAKVNTFVELYEKTCEVERQANATLRSFFDTAPVMMGVVEVSEDDILHLTDNAATGRFFGVAPERLSGRRASTLGVPPDYLRAWLRSYWQSERSGQPVRFEYPHETSAGTRWVSAIVHCIERLPEGRCRCSYVAEDVTERKRVEEALRQSEQRFARFMGHLPGLAWIKDLQGRYVYANDAAAKAFRRTQDDLYGKTDKELLPPETAAQFEENDRLALANEMGVQVVETLEHEDGIVHHSVVTKFPIMGAEGKPVLIGGMAMDITDRLRAEQILAESDERFRQLAENVNEVFWMTDPHTTELLYISPAYERIWGRTCQSLYDNPRSFMDAIHPDDQERVRRAVLEDQSRGEQTDKEYRVVRPDGSVRWVRDRAFPVHNAAGQFYRLVGIIDDFTERKEAEERFRQLADAMPQIVWTAGADGVIDYSNRRWHEFSSSPVSVGNEVWEQVVHPDDMPTAAGRWAESLRSGTAFEMDIRLRDGRTGGYRWHLMRTVPVRNQAGEVVRWYGTATDIDRRRRTGEANRFLAQASAVLASVVDYETTLQKVANLAVPHFADWSAVDLAEEGGTLRWLAVAHQEPEKVRLVERLMRDYPPDPDSTTGAYAVLRAGKAEIIEAIPDELLVQGTRDEEHLRLIRSLGLRSSICVPLGVLGKPLGVLTFATAESGRTYDPSDLALAEDLARRAAVAIENANLYRALQEADRRKDEFLATLAHELRNPLAPLRNALQILKLSGGNRQVFEQAREMMERQLGQMVRLIDDLLDVSRINQGKIVLRKERVGLAMIVQSAVETSRPLIEAGQHELIVTLPPTPVDVDADLTRLAQVLANLLNNAAKYTPRGGRIELAVEHQGSDAVVTVRDNGIGIPAGMLPHIFEIFTQGDRALERAQGGLGIGLTLVKRLVEMHGGSVTAGSEGEGRGSEFVVRLPAVLVRAAQRRTRAGSSEERANALGRKHRIVVVDDNEDAAQSLALMLRLLGQEVHVAHDGVAGVQAVAQVHPGIVLLDIGMPKMNGYEAARQIRGLPGGNAMLLVALTGWGQEEDRRRSQEAGFDQHIVKPVEPAALEKILSIIEAEPA